MGESNGRRPGPPRKNPACLLNLEKVSIEETIRVEPLAEYLAEVATSLPLTPKQLAEEIRTRGAGLRAISIMREPPSWWPILDTRSSYHLHLIFEGKEPQVLPLPARIKRLWLVKLDAKETANADVKALPASVSHTPPAALPEPGK